MIAGYRLRVSPFLQPLPVLFISPACPVSDEVRDEMNAWERLVAAIYYGQATVQIDCDAGDISYGIYD